SATLSRNESGCKNGPCPVGHRDCDHCRPENGQYVLHRVLLLRTEHSPSVGVVDRSILLRVLCADQLVRCNLRGGHLLPVGSRLGGTFRADVCRLSTPSDRLWSHQSGSLLLRSLYPSLFDGA